MIDDGDVGDESQEAATASQIDDMEENLEQDKGEEEEEGDEEDDDEGWITPGNVASVKRSMGAETTNKGESICVGCLTTDFAMQVRSKLYMLQTSIIHRLNYEAPYSIGNVLVLCWSG